MRQIMIDDSDGLLGSRSFSVEFRRHVSKRLHDAVEGPMLSATLRHSLDN